METSADRARREGTGLEPPAAVQEAQRGRLGIWLFLASEVMLFGALVVAYLVLRAQAADWPDPSGFLDLRLGALNCLVLVASSVTMVASWWHYTRGRAEESRRFLGLTNLLALLFLAIKGVEYGEKLASQVLASDRTFLVLYFTLTGLHVVHVLGGLGVNLYLWRRARALDDAMSGPYGHWLEIAGIYWHFVDLMWLLLFVILYI